MELYDAPNVAETAETVQAFALQALNCEHTGLSLAARRGQLEVAAFTDEVVEELYQRQIEDGEGPAFAALTGRNNQLSWAVAKTPQQLGCCGTAPAEGRGACLKCSLPDSSSRPVFDSQQLR